MCLSLCGIVSASSLCPTVDCVMLSLNANPRSIIIWVSLAVVICAALTALFACRKGYNRPLWFLAGLFVPNLLVTFLLPNLNKVSDDSKRLRWEFVTDLGTVPGILCLFDRCACHLLFLLALKFTSIPASTHKHQPAPRARVFGHELGSYPCLRYGLVV